MRCCTFICGARHSQYGCHHGGMDRNVAKADGNAHEKDAVENFLHAEVCRGTVNLVEAQRQIATDWLAVYRQNGLKPQ